VALGKKRQAALALMADYITWADSKRDPGL